MGGIGTSVTDGTDATSPGVVVRPETSPELDFHPRLGVAALPPPFLEISKRGLRLCFAEFLKSAFAAGSPVSSTRCFAKRTFFFSTGTAGKAGAGSISATGSLRLR